MLAPSQETLLLKAWERTTQMEAVKKVSELFPEADTSDAVVTIVADTSAVEDAEAGFCGVPIMETADEDAWEEYVPWAEVEAQTGQGSSSGV